ncbi:unnamed protein product [Calicophoron daubneyi]|uniref:tRNA 2-thiocytidine biosynthesis protein TtcA n=1 Tax=Calicophoron daubneyi TaxID=300641 RepID=A0AAV2TPG3_CALDB
MKSAHRTFYTMPTKPHLLPSESVLQVAGGSILNSPSHSTTEEYTAQCVTNNVTDSSVLLNYIDTNVVGRHKIFRGPFGDRKTIYCDWTASGRALRFIEEFISTEVLPSYGNTHTTITVTSLQTTMYRHEAREIIRNAVRASAADAVIFVGSGCTGAIHKLIHNLNLEKPPIVIVGPFEHHSNMLPWRHLAAKVSRVATDETGTVSIESLEELLKVESVNAQELGCKLIVCMAAASNITGILVDTNKFSSLIHRYGGLSFWDYATAAPYVKIDMNPVISGPDQELVYKDAVYFSMHKFVGGPQTPGVLIAKKALFAKGEEQPCGGGGGTVFFVRRDNHIYLKEVEEREEGGTPAIVESIRAGLVMQLKEAVTSEVIMEREEMFVKRIWDRLADCPNIMVLGGKEALRLPIISVVIRHPYPFLKTDENESPHCLFLHHNFVAALLNDLFGIQARSGCACAGPYAMDLLGIDEALAKLYEETLSQCQIEPKKLDAVKNAPQHEIIRPGFTRLSFPFFMPEKEMDFVLDAVRFVAAHGWAFVPLYQYNPATGEWKHRQHDPSRDRKWLSNVTYTGGKMSWTSAKIKDDSSAPADFTACLERASEELHKAVKSIDLSTAVPVPDDTNYFDECSRNLRWFLLPSEAAAQIRNQMDQLAIPSPSPAPWLPGTTSYCPCFCPDLQDIRTSSKSTFVLARLSTQGSTKCSSSRDCSRLSEGLAPVCQIPEIPQAGFGFNHPEFEEVTVTVTDTGHGRRRSASVPVRMGSPPLFKTESQDGPRRSRSRSSMPCAANYMSALHPAQVKDIAEVAYNFTTTEYFDISRNPSGASNSNAGQISGFNVGTYRGNSNDLTNTSEKKTAERFKHLKRNLWKTPPKLLFKSVLKAIRRFDMIHPGDRVLVCLSGGKDSLSLLHCMHQYQQAMKHTKTFDSPEPFTLGAVTVDPGSSAYDPRPLIPYLAELGIPYFYEKQGIIHQAAELPYEVSSICSFCSRMKRGRIYACARRNNYNVIAIGQHLDDVAESFFMSCFHNGLLLTMKANYKVRQGDLRVIRPLVFVREHDTRAFAEMAKLPVIPENCPGCFSAPKERIRIKRMLMEQEILFPSLFSHLLTTMMPLIDQTTTRPLKCNRRVGAPNRGCGDTQNNAGCEL